MSINQLDIQGVGMTSQRTRDRLMERLKAKGIKNQEVLRVMSLVPRHLFVDEAMSSRSYEDSSFPIGHGQTISQPYIVARMTELIMESHSLENVLAVKCVLFASRIWNVTKPPSGIPSKVNESFKLLGTIKSPTSN